MVLIDKTCDLKKYIIKLMIFFIAISLYYCMPTLTWTMTLSNSGRLYPDTSCMSGLLLPAVISPTNHFLCHLLKHFIHVFTCN